MVEQLEAASFRVLIAASGTGGHLFPAIYIADKLRDNYQAEILFVGSGRPLEAKIVKYNRETIDIVGLKRLGIKGFLRWLTKLPVALVQTVKILSKFKPNIIVGVGGYVSVLPVLAGFLTGTPTWIHEAERAPGLANKFLSLFATRISTAYKETKFLTDSKVIFTGHPINPKLLQLTPNKPKQVKKVLILGGSQGADGVDRGVIMLAPEFKAQSISVTHQSRGDNIAWLKDAYAKEGIDAEVVSFIESMAELYATSDLIITRAGAGTVRELLLVGRPAILIPLPRAEEQFLNANIMVRAGRGVVVEEGEGFPERLKQAFLTVSSANNYPRFFTAGDPEWLKDAAEQIASGCRGLT